MTPRAASAIAGREMRQLDWPRALLAVVASFALGRVIAEQGADATLADATLAAACAIAFVTSQLSLTRNLGVMPVYFTTPFGGAELARTLALVPIAASAIVGLAFAGGVATRVPAQPQLWLAAVEAAVTCTLIMQSARLRRGSARSVYRAAALLGACVIACAAIALPWYGGAALSLICAALALRGFAQTLRRFDPVPGF
jgi:hypothetical protein